MNEKQDELNKKSLTEGSVLQPLPKGSENRPVETGGPTGPEPTRYGDWERRGRCIDF